MTAPYERSTVVCIDAGALLCVKLRDPTARVVILSPPGGGIEAGETPADAAVREVLEETGHQVELDAATERCLRYPYTWDGRDADVRCYLYRGRLLGTRAEAAAITPQAYQEGVFWVPLCEIGGALAYLPPFRDAVLELAGLPGR